MIYILKEMKFKIFLTLYTKKKNYNNNNLTYDVLFKSKNFCLLTSSSDEIFNYFHLKQTSCI